MRKTSSKKRTGSTSQIKVAGKTYKKSSCFLTKASAKAAAKRIRSTGKNARVVGKCVFTRGKAKRRAA